MSAYYFYKKIRIKPLDKYPIAVYNYTHKGYKGGNKHVREEMSGL